MQLSEDSFFFLITRLMGGEWGNMLVFGDLNRHLFYAFIWCTSSYSLTRQLSYLRDAISTSMCIAILSLLCYFQRLSNVVLQILDICLIFECDLYVFVLTSVFYVLNVSN